MIDLNIRRAAPDDAPKISDMIVRTVRVTNASDYAPSIIEAICLDFSSEMIIERMAYREVFVALAEDVIAGTISLAVARLHSLFVEPDYQSRGVGRQLVSFVERHAVGTGVDELRLNSSFTARPFYERLGYSFEGLSTDGMTVMMVRALTKPMPHPGFT